MEMLMPPGMKSQLLRDIDASSILVPLLTWLQKEGAAFAVLRSGLPAASQAVRALANPGSISGVHVAATFHLGDGSLAWSSDQRGETQLLTSRMSLVRNRHRALPKGRGAQFLPAKQLRVALQG